MPDGRHLEHRLIRTAPGAGAVVVDDQQQVLLLWRHRFITGSYGWEIPIGKIEAGEDPADSAAREVEEETGWRPGPLRPLLRVEPAAVTQLEIALDTVNENGVAPFWSVLLTGSPGNKVYDSVFDPTSRVPGLWFQGTDEHEPPRQRWHFDLWLAPEMADERITAAVAVGGSVVDDSQAPSFTVLADPDATRSASAPVSSETEGVQQGPAVSAVTGAVVTASAGPRCGGRCGPRTAAARTRRCAVAAHFGVPAVHDVAVGIHQGKIDERDLRELAPALLAAAADGDRVARNLVRRQAGEIAAMALVAMRRLGLTELPTPVVLGGSHSVIASSA